MRMQADFHYRVEPYDSGPFMGQIRALHCKWCEFMEGVRQHHRVGDRSGQGRYNRARAKMVRHIHAKHREEAAAVVLPNRQYVPR